MTDEMEMASFIDGNSERAFQLAMEEAEFSDAWEVGGLVDGEQDFVFPSASLALFDDFDDIDDWDEDFIRDMEADVMGWKDNA